MTSAQDPPLPNPPFYSIRNISNLRDAALHFRTTPNCRIRPEILFRSAEVSKLDRAGWTSVHDLGVAHVFDLRSKPEVEKGWGGIINDEKQGKDGQDVRPGWIQDMEAADVKRTWVPVFKESDYSPERLAERYLKYMAEETQGFVEAYHDILVNAGEAFRTILLYLARLPPPFDKERVENEKLGALIHCTAGKDRTGIFFGVLFDFLGVPREAIAEEYNLTELGLGHIRDEIVARLMTSPGFKKYTLSQMAGKSLNTEEMTKIMQSKDGGWNEELVVPPEIIEKGRQAGLRMVSAKKDAMLESLKMVDREWGNAEAYLTKVCGLGDEDLKALRRNLMIEQPDQER